MFWVDDDRPATVPTSAASRTRSDVAGSSSSSPAVTAAQMAPDGQQGQQQQLVVLHSSRGMARVSSANVRAPTASQVY